MKFWKESVSHLRTGFGMRRNSPLSWQNTQISYLYCELLLKALQTVVFLHGAEYTHLPVSSRGVLALHRQSSLSFIFEKQPHTPPLLLICSLMAGFSNCPVWKISFYLSNELNFQLQVQHNNGNVFSHSISPRSYGLHDTKTMSRTVL